MITQKFMPFGMENAKVISNRTDLYESIKNQDIVAAKITEYAISSKEYILHLCEGIYGTMRNEYFEKKNTAASMVGTTISVIVSSEKDGMFVCSINPKFEDAKTALYNYSEGTRLIGKVVTLLQYGAIIDVGLGAASLLHTNELSSFYGKELCSPSEVLSIGDVVTVYTKKNDNGDTRFSLIKDIAEPKTFSLLEFLRNKIAS